VRFEYTVGQRPERTLRVTCCDSSALTRATEIAGLFLSAICSAFWRDNCRPAGSGAWAVPAFCGSGRLVGGPAESACAHKVVTPGSWGSFVCAKPHPGTSSTQRRKLVLQVMRATPVRVS